MIKEKINVPRRQDLFQGGPIYHRAILRIVCLIIISLNDLRVQDNDYISFDIFQI